MCYNNYIHIYPAQNEQRAETRKQQPEVTREVLRQMREEEKRPRKWSGQCYEQLKRTILVRQGENVF